MLFEPLGGVENISLPGAELTLYRNFLAPDQADQLSHDLAAKIAWRQDDMNIAQRRVALPRLQAWYGDFAYSYSGIKLQPLPWFTELTHLKAQIEALGYAFNALLCNLYRDGNDSVGWHADNERELGSQPLIASYSLGATRRFEIKPNKQHSSTQGQRKLQLELAHNSLLIMQPPMQRHWLHQIPKEPSIDKPRINLTFRQIVSDTR